MYLDVSLTHASIRSLEDDDSGPAVGLSAANDGFGLLTAKLLLLLMCLLVLVFSGKRGWGWGGTGTWRVCWTAGRAGGMNDANVVRRVPADMICAGLRMWSSVRERVGRLEVPAPSSWRAAPSVPTADGVLSFSCLKRPEVGLLGLGTAGMERNFSGAAAAVVVVVGTCAAIVWGGGGAPPGRAFSLTTSFASASIAACRSRLLCTLRVDGWTYFPGVPHLDAQLQMTLSFRAAAGAGGSKKLTFAVAVAVVVVVVWMGAATAPTSKAPTARGLEEDMEGGS